MMYMQQGHLQQISGRDVYIQIFTSIILYMNSICIAQWLLGANIDILLFSGAFARRHKFF